MLIINKNIKPHKKRIENGGFTIQTPDGWIIPAKISNLNIDVNTDTSDWSNIPKTWTITSGEMVINEKEMENIKNILLNNHG